MGCNAKPPSFLDLNHLDHKSSSFAFVVVVVVFATAVFIFVETKGVISPTKAASAPPNRVRRRVITLDYGKPIYKASSRSALLAALVGCIEGHESLHKVGILHRDISINNLMINEDSGNSSWPAFLIDLDLAIREERAGASGAKGKTGTRTFMAIGVLLGAAGNFEEQ
ncbi:serine threonine-protein kinase sgk2 [Colletotrichum tabaci]|uniref:EKC/KEOPS complex subunit BUD32 n=1 Tax=Colletotrichum tabaci TaxID=1209068 RepID=A0AAV9TGY7_9PEZI